MSKHSFNFLALILVTFSLVACGGTSHPSATPEVESDVVSDSYLTFSGAIGVHGAQLSPALASTMRPVPEVQGKQEYTLRLRTVSGQTFDLPLMVLLISQATVHQSHFAVSMRNPGQVTSVQLLDQQGQALPLIDKDSNDSSFKPDVGQASLSFWRQGEKLRLKWNHLAEPFVSVMHVTNRGLRTVMAQNLVGGDASVDIGNLDVGGVFEVSLSNRQQARLVLIRNLK
jgi:hypothetical protein